MRIALVAPSPNPFLVGGAETLWWGMLDHLNKETSHQADLIKIPVKETSLVDLVAGYEAFSRLDLSGFDAVITGKYPAWMVQHPYHCVDMLHRCRGFYDWYPEAEAGGIDYRGTEPAVLELLRYMRERSGERAGLAEFFERFRALAARASAHPDIARHPGPLGRAVIHYLDGVGLARANVKRYTAIAETVKRRRDYFPPGVPVHVAYHPTNKTGFHSAGEDYFFTVSRFYPSKRIDLLVEAYRRTRIPLPFKIAGAGDEEAKLRRIAGDDPRFEFLGFVRDEELVELYARAIAVPFVPADEDYGYITLEAMLAGKPVITTPDSGGPMELVRDGVNGLVAAADPDALARAFERIHDDAPARRAMGEKALERARQVNWANVMDTVLGTRESRRTVAAPRPKVTVLNAYGIHPPDNGGKYRIHWLYKTLARRVDVDAVTLGLRVEGDALIEAAEGFREIRIARSREHEDADIAAQTHSHAPVYDITALEHIHLTPAYLTALENCLAGSSLAVLAHPYMLTALRKVGWTGPVIHESQNCEHQLKSRMLPENETSRRLLKQVEEAERYCCRETGLVYATCEADAEGLLAEYGGRREDMVVIPNGTDTHAIAFADRATRARLRRRLKAGTRPIALFLASGHRPNLEAAEHLFEVAKRLPEVAFAFVGNAAAAFTHRTFPENIWLVGTVTEEVRNLWLHVADVALNPMLYGGGTNLKLLDYFSAGTPVISTPIGLRGTGAEAGRHAVVASMDGLEAAIRQLLAAPEETERMTRAARTLVEERFDWEALGGKLYDEIVARGLLGPARVVPANAPAPERLDRGGIQNLA